MLIMVALFTACKKEPVACFTTDKSTAAVNTPIQCDASCSQNVQTYRWLGTSTYILGNGKSVTETYTFTTPGKYLIKLEVTNGSKGTIVAHEVNIY